MSTSVNWLERLSRATDYVDLQVMFTEIIADLQDGENNEQLAVAIDEAIRRLEIERRRDAAELESFEQEFSAFREQQSGFSGWFRRHLPFSKTRQQEKEHRETIADQQAEILADNLVIARAQMVKEYLLPAESRRLGQTPDQWRQRLTGYRSDVSVSAFAADVQGLLDELKRSHEFVGLIEADVDAFEKADFADQADRQRKKTDLAAARDELAFLKREVADEEALKPDALRRLGELISDDLGQGDPEFHKTLARTRLLETARGQAVTTLADAGGLLDQLTSLVDLECERQALPGQFQHLQQQAGQLQTNAENADRRRSELSRELRGNEPLYQDANRDVERARSAFGAAKQLYEAYVREQGIAEANPFGAASSVENEYRKWESTLRQAESRFRSVAGPYESLRVQLADAERQVQGLSRQIDQVLSQQRTNAERQQHVREEIAAGCDRLQPLVRHFQQQARDYLAALRPLNQPSQLPAFDSLNELLQSQYPSLQRQGGSQWFDGGSSSPTSQDLDLMNRVRTALAQEVKQLEQDIANGRATMQTAWSNRCRELLSEELATEVIAARGP